ncbi:MAG TPA: TIGR01777 family oxidoreductase [Chlamydiales bacterium]
MRILLSGSSGFIGSALLSHFVKRGDEVVPLLRKDPNFCSAKAFEGFDAVIHLAGESVMGRWTCEKKRRLWSSRVDTTRRLSAILSTLNSPPKVFLTASAIGYYGDRGETVLTEDNLQGQGFLSELCSAWEKAAEVPGIRCVHTRFGMVLGSGGALKKMRLLYKLGFGGKLGLGQQWVSWVALEDAVRAIDFALKHLEGPVNVVSPDALRQSELAKMLAASLHRPSFFSLPRWAVRLFFGQMGEELFLSSARVVPKKLQESGFHFKQTLQKVLSTLDFKESI